MDFAYPAKLHESWRYPLLEDRLAEIAVSDDQNPFLYIQYLRTIRDGTLVMVDSMRTDLDPVVLERIERQAESLKFVPPWAHEIVEARETEQGKGR